MMIKEAIIRLSQKQDLSYDEAEQVMNEIMEGKATDVQMSAYLTALSLKGETIDEITASAAGMRAHCIKLLHNMDVLEIVGTGGDGANSFNISTINFFKRDIAYAYKLGKITQFETPKDISEFGCSTAPQSFVYIS